MGKYRHRAHPRGRHLRRRHPLPKWRHIFNLRCGAPVSIRSWELEVFTPRSDLFLVVRWRTMAEMRRWKGAPELLAPAPRRR
jgi:hypothetical protein